MWQWWLFGSECPYLWVVPVPLLICAGGGCSRAQPVCVWPGLELNSDPAGCADCHRMSPVLLSTTLHQSELFWSLTTLADLASLSIASSGSSVVENFAKANLI